MAREAQRMQAIAAAVFAILVFTPAAAHASSYQGLAQYLFVPVLAIALGILSLFAFVGGPPSAERRWFIGFLAALLCLFAIPAGFDGGRNPAEVQIIYWGLLGANLLVVLAAKRRGGRAPTRRMDGVAPLVADAQGRPAVFKFEAHRERHVGDPYRQSQRSERDLEIAWNWRDVRSADRSRRDALIAGVASTCSLLMILAWPPLFLVLMVVAALHAYRALAYRVNHTVLRVREARLSVVHRPLLTDRGSIEISTHDIEAIKVKEAPSFRSTSALVSFALAVKRRDGDEVVLFSELATARHAEWLAHQIADATNAQVEKVIGAPK